MTVARVFVCADCSNRWQVVFTKGKPGACPQCGSANIERAVQGKGWAILRKGNDKGRRWIR